MSRSKYGAKAAVDTTGTRRFASQLERDRYEELRLLEKARVILDLQCQPRIALEPGIFFKPDFVYVERENDTETLYYEDAKGFAGTDRFRLMCKLWALHGPAPLRITRRGRKGGFVIERTIVPLAHDGTPG